MKDISMRTLLRCGQTLRLYAAFGTCVIAACGTLSIQELSGRMGPSWQAALQEGEVHQVAQGGWISILAHSHAEVIVMQKQPEPNLMTRSLAGLSFVARALLDCCRDYAARRSG